MIAPRSMLLPSMPLGPSVEATAHPAGHFTGARGRLLTDTMLADALEGNVDPAPGADEASMTSQVAVLLRVSRPILVR